MKCFANRYRPAFIAGLAALGSALATPASAADYLCAMTLPGLGALYLKGEGDSPGQAYCAIQVSRDRSGTAPACDPRRMDGTGLCQPRVPDPVISEARRGGSDTATGPRRAYRCQLPMEPDKKKSEQPWVLIEAASFREILDRAYAVGGHSATPKRELCMHAETFDALLLAVQNQSR